MKKRPEPPPGLPCCDMMREWAFEGEDLVLQYWPQDREITIPLPPRRGGGVVVIQHCPWCGKELPRSLSEERYASIEQEMGEAFEKDYPEKMPRKYRSDKWWRERGL